MENTRYSSTKRVWEYWLENPRTDNASNARIVYGYHRNVDNSGTSNSFSNAIHPAIEVHKFNILY